MSLAKPFALTQAVPEAPRDDFDTTAGAEMPMAARPLARVVDAQGRTLGLVAVEDVAHVLIAPAQGEERVPYLRGSIFGRARQRLVWLLMLFLAGTFTGGVLQMFEAELAQVVALSFFIPLLIGTGGNAGAQAVTAVIRALVLHEIAPRDAWRVLGREALTGLVLGGLLGGVAFIHAMLWMGDPQLALVVALAVPAICVWSASAGALVPLVAQRLRLDPTVMSAPMITTLVDATGLLIYFGIAQLILGL